MRLCRNDSERARIVDMSRRLRPVSRASIGVMFAAGVLAVPTFGWRPLVPMLVASGVFAVLQARLDHYRRPERVLAASWALAQAMVVAMILTAGAQSELLYPLFAFPTMLATVVWPTRWVVVGTVVSATTLVSVAFATNAALVLTTLPVLTHPLAVLFSTALVASIARDCELASRSAALVDQLTGALTRTALDARGRELAHQSAATGRGVALILADVDHFKRINDEHGHAAGDVALREVAYRLRKALPAFAPVYRLGGEEFVVLLPDATIDTAREVAARMRTSLAEGPIRTDTVTMSFGLTASPPGQTFELERVIADADAALYEAKRAGRDCIRCAEPADVTPLHSPPTHDRRSSERAPLTGPAGAAAVPSIAPAPREQDDDSSWLVDSLERQHLLDLTKRLLHANHVPFAVAFAAVVVMGPWYGWWPILPVVLGSIVYRAVERRLDRKRRPEFAFGAAWLIAQAANAAAYFVAIIPAHPEHYVSPAFALPLLMIMVVSASAVMPPRGVLIASAFTAAIMVAVTLHMDAAVVTRRPSELAFSLALLITIAMIGCAVGRSAVNHRGAAIVDGLTGLLNRRALEVRTIELGHQAAATGEPVAVVIGDVDNFKRINDERGHATGDRALAAVAERLHGELRAFEGLYRFGGEEFAVLLAGTSAAEALATAERLRVAVAAGSIEGIPVTMSFGIAATSAGQAADFDELFAEADRALYQAKRAGRDRVVGATPMLAPARAA